MKALLPLTTLLVLASMGAAGCSSFGLSDSDSRQVLLADSPKAERHHRRGVRLTKAGKFQQAEAAFHKALIANADFGPAHNNLGLLFYNRGDLYSAAKSFEQAMRLLPERAEPINNLAMTLEGGGRYQDAIELYEAARSMEPENAEFLANLVRARIRHGVVDFRVQQELEELAFLDVRPDWRAFAQRRLTMMSRVTDRGPDEIDTNPLNDAEDRPEELPTPALHAPLRTPSAFLAEE